MTDKENHGNNKHPLEINVGDQIKIVSDVSVAISDLTVAVPGLRGHEEQLVFDEQCPSDLIAERVCEAIDVPVEEPDKHWLQEQIEERREEMSKKGWKCSAEIPIPTGWLKHLGLPEQIPLKFTISGGEEKRVTKHTIIRKQVPPVA